MIFNTSSGTIAAVPLLDASGNILSHVPDAPGFYKLTAENIDTLDFYLDHNGSRYMDILTISVSASEDVPLEAFYFWSVHGENRQKILYADQIETLNAENECPTVYPGGEPIPHGTIHFVRVESGVADSGQYEVYACVMARVGTIDTKEPEPEEIPDHLDVSFAGIKLSVYSEPERTYDVPLSTTKLASGKVYIQACPELEFQKTYFCTGATYAEKQAIVSMLGVPGDLVVDGVVYSGCYIQGPLTFTQPIPGKSIYSYIIKFIQHTSIM